MKDGTIEHFGEFFDLIEWIEKDRIRLDK